MKYALHIYIYIFKIQRKNIIGNINRAMKKVTSTTNIKLKYKYNN